MTIGIARRRGKPRWLVLGGAVVIATLIAATAAYANLSGSTFEGGDGNLIVTTPGNTDWANVAGVNIGYDLTSGSTDNAFGQGTKEDSSAVSVVDGSIPPNKNDLTRFYEASEYVNGHNFLYLAWERAVNIGNANLDFEINQHPTDGFTGTTTGAVTLNRTAGDLLVTYDFGGSGTPTLGLNFWLTSATVPAIPGFSTNTCYSANSFPCWGDHKSLSGFSEGAVNTGTVTDPLGTNSPRDIGTGLFGEAAINLTDAGVFPSGTCEAFGSTFLKSRSSSSFTAELKDFIAPVPVNISNCGTVTIHKLTQNSDGTFGFSTTGGLSPSTFSLANGGEQDYSSVAAGSYTVVEGLTAAQVTAGWTLSNLVCGTVTGTGTSATPTLSTGTVSITMAAGGNVDCTYTNHINLSPSIATTLSASSANIGDSIHDSATLTGATATAGGTVTYHAYAGANTCTGTDLLNSQVTVTNGVVPDSANFVPSSAGTYSFQAVYSGDGNNNSATSVCSTEQLLVRANPGVSTTLSATTANIGDSVHDSATLSGQTADAGGTVTYHAYAGANTCSGTDLLNSQVTVTNGVVPDSANFVPSIGGSYSFQAVYSGDTKNNGATSVCSTEQLLVKTNPGVLTTLSATPVNIGDSVHDSASLTGATSDAGGTVTYHAYAGANTCTGTDLLNSQVTVTNGVVPDSANFTPANAGTYSFQAVYSGDTKNNGATSDCSTEQLVVNPNNPAISTAQNLLPNDSATITGATSTAGGTITFKLFNPSAPSCGGTAAYSQTVSVSGNGTYVTTNTTFLATTAGTWRWLVSYTGDGNNQPATSACGVESFTITQP